MRCARGTDVVISHGGDHEMMCHSRLHSEEI